MKDKKNPKGKEIEIEVKIDSKNMKNSKSKGTKNGKSKSC